MDHVFPNRITPPNSKQRVNFRNIRTALRILANLLVRVGVMSDYREVFWKMAKQTMAKGNVEATAGRQSASFYNPDVREEEPALARRPA